ncbi:MAG: F0F1 ATP synthase subunit gamma [Candidatus Symbiothrix sp.]|jgi:F-type H+-transporting ATPase subunit gamma|nr:F0F1 ATP synthase subunit gamma [Candidatus Symbiothrix sp.]
MPSLKEIKSRIGSVKSTKKITSAMKMVASAKLRKAQKRIESFLPYQQKLDEILKSFLASSTEFQTDLAEVRDVKRVAIVVLSSNSSLCGAFNANVFKLFKETLAHYQQLPDEAIEIYAIGKKIEGDSRKLNRPFDFKGSYIPLMDEPTFAGAKQIAQALMADFRQHKIDKVDLVYNRFKSSAVQVPTVEQFLPVSSERLPVTGDVQHSIQTDYIVEPDKNTILQALIPQSLQSKIYAVIADSAAAEQAARLVAMQVATDNAEDILDELTIQFNKQRQQAITSELLDIIGGAEAQK